MSVPESSMLSMHKLRRFDGPQYFLGGGFAAGLLVFLVWLASLPGHDRHAAQSAGNGDAEAGAIAAPGAGVLSGITGEDTHAGASVSSTDDAGMLGEGENSGESGLSADDEAAAQLEGDADGMAVAEDGSAPAQPEEGAALTDSLLDTPAAAPVTANGDAASAPGAPLLPYYVEVEVAPGQVQVLQLNAESPEHARAILRDFRGNPRVLRGPSTEPLQ